MKPFNLKTFSLALLSIILLLSGGMMLYKDFVPDNSLNYHSRSLDATSIDKLTTSYTVDSLINYAISRGNADPFHLTVARYQDETGNYRQAIVFPSNSGYDGPVLKTDDLRNRAWNHAAQSIREHVGQNAIFFTWWDNAQRLHLMTSRNGWAFAPIAEAYPQIDEKDLWREIGGDFDPDSKRLLQLAEWLMMDATKGLNQVKKVLSPEQSAYFLISLDDLARLQELSVLVDRPIPLESRVFRSTDNVHSLIVKVKSWATEGGTGSYMVQPIPGIGVRAWRITDLKAENLLLVRLLPFTHSLEKPLESTKIVFRSEWGGYITIFELEV